MLKNSAAELTAGDVVCEHSSAQWAFVLTLRTGARTAAPVVLAGVLVAGPRGRAAGFAREGHGAVIGDDPPPFPARVILTLGRCGFKVGVERRNTRGYVCGRGLSTCPARPCAAWLSTVLVRKSRVPSNSKSRRPSSVRPDKRQQTHAPSLLDTVSSSAALVRHVCSAKCL